MILLIDNYDSFVYNIARYFRELRRECKIVRNDVVDIKTLQKQPPSHIVISPGPCAPNQAGQSNAIIERFGSHIPILGICLGHQCIGQVYGGRVIKSPPHHAKVSQILHDQTGLFEGLPSPLRVARYHSLAVDSKNLPNSLSVTAREATGIIMAVAHQKHPVFGIQFHPESILTQGGHQIFNNFLRVKNGKCFS